MRYSYLNKVQLNAELEKCLQCPTKPCMNACPVHCSPHDFIAAAKEQNWEKAAEVIYSRNPLGETCGLICPDKFCIKACIRKNIDAAIRIPAIQATVLKNAREHTMPTNIFPFAPNNRKIAVIGLGPAGIGAVSELLKHGFQVTAWEKETTVGGALNLIPTMRLPREILQLEWQKLLKNPLLEAKFNTPCQNYAELLSQGFDAVIVTVGEQKSRRLGIIGEELAVDYTTYLKCPTKYQTADHVVVIGGGAAAVDCAITVAQSGAKHVEMFVRRRICDMRITNQELLSLLENRIDITTMTRVERLEKDTADLTAYTIKTVFADDGRLTDVPDTQIRRTGLSLVILALGSTRAEEVKDDADIFYAGDFANGSSTAVEAIASGQEAAHKIIVRFAPA